MTANASGSNGKSFLIVDCGHIHTTAHLFDVVGDAYRLIACARVPTTVWEPWSDMGYGVQQAIEQLGQITGRKLLNERGDLIKPARPSGSGIDQFVMVVSAAPPLRTLIVGLFDEVSLQSSRRVLRSIYAHELDSFSLADNRKEGEQLAVIEYTKPDLIFIAGGTDGGAEKRLLRLVETVALGVSLIEDNKAPQIIFAGNKKTREMVRDVLGTYTNVQMADNVRPDLKTEYLDDAARLVRQVYEDLKIQTLPGIRDLKRWTTVPLMPTAHGFAAVAEYFAALHQARIMGVDLGGETITWLTATPEQQRLAIYSNHGMGQSVRHLLSQVEEASIMRWLPEEVTESEIRNFIYNKALWPHTLPLTEKELYLEQATARELLRVTMAETAVDWGWPADSYLPPFRLLLARGQFLADTPRPGQVVLMLLDALQPWGIFSIALDRRGVLPALGVLTIHQPVVAVQALEKEVLTNLGWVIVPVGKGRPGQQVLHVSVQSGEEHWPDIEVTYGSLEVLPLAPGQSAEVTLKPARRFDIGYGPGQGKKITLHGGTAGIVIDARGRPLELPSKNSDRRTLIRRWLRDVGGV